MSVPTLSNPHLEALESVFEQAQEPIQWLIISHSDPRLIRGLQPVAARVSAAVLQVSQAQWDFEGRELQETIAWALNHQSIKNVVLAGDSQIDTSSVKARVLRSGKSGKDPRKESYERLVAGVQRAAEMQQTAKSRLVAKLKELAELSSVRQRREAGDLELFGLFYRSESGSFLAYDLTQNQFQPLN